RRGYRGRVGCRVNQRSVAAVSIAEHSRVYRHGRCDLWGLGGRWSTKEVLGPGVHRFLRLLLFAKEFLQLVLGGVSRMRAQRILRLSRTIEGPVSAPGARADDDNGHSHRPEPTTNE